jgi:hypothetical protein
MIALPLWAGNGRQLPPMKVAEFADYILSKVNTQNLVL